MKRVAMIEVKFLSLWQKEFVLKEWNEYDREDFVDSKVVRCGGPKSCQTCANEVRAQK